MQSIEYIYRFVSLVVSSCESRTDRREPVHAGKTPSSPLSPSAQRLLMEFGFRHGVVRVCVCVCVCARY